MHRHSFVFILLFAVVTGACSSTGAPRANTPTQAAHTTTRPTLPPRADQIIITFGAYEAERSLYEPLINAFNAEHVDMRVQFVSLDGKTFVSEDGNQVSSGAQALRQIASAADTAVTSVATDDIATGYLTDLTPFMDADQAFNRADYFPSALGGFHLEDGIYVLPRVTSVALLSYNKRLWAETGLPAPRPDTTWTELVAAAEQMARKSGDTVDVYGLMDGDDGFMVFLSELERAGIRLFSRPADEVQFEQPEIVAVGQRILSLVDSGALHVFKPEGSGVFSSEDLAILAREQRLAIWRADRFALDPNDPSLSFEIGRIPMPTLAQPPYVFGQEGYVMSSGTQHPDHAWRWLSWLSRQLVITPDEERYSASIPARASVAELSGYWERTDASTAAAVRAIVQQPAPTLTHIPDEHVYSALMRWWPSTVSEQRNVAEGLRLAQESLEEIIVQNTPEEAPRERAPISVATPHVIPEDATVIVFHPYNLEFRRVVRIAEAFTQAHPSIIVEIRSVEEPVDPQKFVIAAGQSDCFSWPSAPTTEQVTATLDLQPVADADTTFDLADIPAGLLAPFKRGDALYGLPHTIDLRTLSYNRVAFEQAGLAPPNATWTLNDFLNAAQRLTQTEAGAEQYGYIFMFDRPDDILFFLNQFDASLSSGHGNALQPDFTNPRVIAALRYIIDTLHVASPHRQIPGYTPDLLYAPDNRSYSLISQGKAGMWLDNGNGRTFFNSEHTSEAYAPTIAPPPMGPGGLSHEDVRISGLYISAETDQTDACWQWLKHLSGEVPSIFGYFPARTSVAESEQFVQSARPGALEVYKAYQPLLQSADQQQSVSASQSQIDLFWFYRAVDRALQGADLERELQDAQFLTEQHLACVRGGERARTCATTVDPEYDGFAAE